MNNFNKVTMNARHHLPEELRWSRRQEAGKSLKEVENPSVVRRL